MPASNQISFCLSQLLSTAAFKKIIFDDNILLFKNQVSKCDEALNIKGRPTNLDVVKTIYKYLDKNYRCEYLYKNCLLNSLIKEKKFQYTSVINELRVNKSIGDTVFINGESVLYEIKTELDSPEKLSRQIADYKKAFTKICVVTHESVFYKYYLMIRNSGIGLMYVENSGELTIHTRPTEVNDDLEHSVIFKMLRKVEYSEIVENYFGHLPHVPNTIYFKECLDLVRTIPILEFQNLAMLQLKKRVAKEQIKIMEIPEELRYICYVLNLKGKHFQNLRNFLDLSFNS